MTADRPAGDLSAWLREMRAALDGQADADVPCGECTACCTASQFVHIEPDEVDTLAHVPAELLFPAPRLPAGHVLMGYDEHGRCPLLVDGRCSIYAHRPRTCRTYDCRIFAAADVAPGDTEGRIGARVGEWRFDHPTPLDRAEHDAVRAAAAFVAGHPEAFAPDPAPTRPGDVAAVAVRLAEAFTGGRPADVAVAIRAVRDARSGNRQL